MPSARTLFGAADGAIASESPVAKLRSVPAQKTNDPRSQIRLAARHLVEHGSYLFFRHQAHFRNPLVPKEWDMLAADPALDDPQVADVVNDVLVARTPGLAPGIYSPVPIARGLADGGEIEDLLAAFRYEMIAVDGKQQWIWQGRPVAPRVRSFFLEHTAFEEALGIWYFEYRVNDEWWDKSYFTGLTPLKVTALDEIGLEATLNSGARDPIEPSSFRLDDREKLFVRTRHFGEVLVSDTVRFGLLRTANEACDEILLGEVWVPLRWPEGQAPT